MRAPGATDELSGRRRARPREVRDVRLMRYVPGTSAIHEMWAGTKLVALGALSIGVLVWPSWRAVAIMTAVLLVAFAAARLPRGKGPRLPWWLAVVVFVGAVLALASGGAPLVRIGGLRLGLGGLDNFALFGMLAVDVLAAAALLSWTTPLAEVAPALGRLVGPLRRLKVPVDEVVGAVALSIRCLPLLLDEARVTRAARIARRPAGARSFKDLGDEAVETVFGSLANAIRRAREMAEAIEARGGVPTLTPETHPFAAVDVLGMAVSLLAVAAMAALR